MAKKVLHFLHSLRRAGSQTLVMRVFENIDQNQVQFDFAIREYMEGDYRKEIIQLGGNIYEIPTINKFNILSVEREIIHILREKGPYSAVHSHSDFHSGYILQAAYRQGINTRIAHSHNTGKDYSKAKGSKVLFEWLMCIFIQRFATDMIAVSRPSAKWLFGSNYLNDDRVTILPNAIDLDPYSKLDEDKQKYRSYCSLPEDKVLIGHIGRFSKQKNHLFLFQIYKSLLRSLPDARLVLVGDGILQPELESWLVVNQIRKKCFFLGVRTDIPEILKSLDLFLFPSLFEGLGLVLIEAQAAGVPCVVSDVVPAESDVGIGLMESVKLDADLEKWVDVIHKSLKKNSRSWNIRYQGLKKAGFDLEEVINDWERLYIADTNS